MMDFQIRTTRDLVHLVLYEEVYQRNNGSEEGASEDLAVMDRFRVWRAEGKTA